MFDSKAGVALYVWDGVLLKGTADCGWGSYSFSKACADLTFLTVRDKPSLNIYEKQEVGAEFLWGISP